MEIIQTLSVSGLASGAKEEIMHLIEHKKGYLCGASDREGRAYKDWRAPYIDCSGLLMIYESNSRPGKHAFVFFTAPAQRLPGKIFENIAG